MFRFTIRDLLWLTVVVAGVGGGWIVGEWTGLGENRWTNRSARLPQKLDRTYESKRRMGRYGR
jgi:hypothetical protein